MRFVSMQSRFSPHQKQLIHVDGCYVSPWCWKVNHEYAAYIHIWSFSPFFYELIPVCLRISTVLYLVQIGQM